MRATDGEGNPLVDDQHYLVQETSENNDDAWWWRPRGAGYTRDIDDAGRYTGVECRSMRETDVPWLPRVVKERASRIVRRADMPPAGRVGRRPDRKGDE